MHQVGSDYYKVGKTTNSADKRLQGLQTGNPQLLVKVAEYPCPLSVEKKLHYLLSGKRVKGEWFRLNQKDLELIDQIMNGHFAQ